MAEKECGKVTGNKKNHNKKIWLDYQGEKVTSTL